MSISICRRPFLQQNLSRGERSNARTRSNVGPSNDIHVSNRVKSPTSPQGGGVSRNNDRRITICPHNAYFLLMSVLSELKILPSDCHFQSDKKIDQQVLSIRRATPALQHQYYAADSVPPLDLLTPLRDDGKRTSQLYSDPSFFFETWRANQLLENTSPRVKLRKVRALWRFVWC